MTTNLAVKLLVWFYSREGHLKTTALLLAHNAQVNVPSGSNDDTPLTLACWKGEAFSYYFFFNTRILWVKEAVVVSKNILLSCLTKLQL